MYLYLYIILIKYLGIFPYFYEKSIFNENRFKDSIVLFCHSLKPNLHQNLSGLII